MQDEIHGWDCDNVLGGTVLDNIVDRCCIGSVATMSILTQILTGLYFLVRSEIDVHAIRL